MNSKFYTVLLSTWGRMHYPNHNLCFLPDFFFQRKSISTSNPLEIIFWHNFSTVLQMDLINIHHSSPMINNSIAPLLNMKLKCLQFHQKQSNGALWVPNQAMLTYADDVSRRVGRQLLGKGSALKQKYMSSNSQHPCKKPSMAKDAYNREKQ